MSTATIKRRSPRRPKSAYPQSPRRDDPKPWLAHFLRTSARQEAISTHYVTVGRKTGWAESPLLDALIRADSRECDALAQEARYVQEEGTLLFAWAGTKAFEAVPA